MQYLVLDASVTIKWYLKDEPHIDKAKLLLQKIRNKKIEPIFPSLWIYEMANTFYSAVLKKRIKKKQAKDFIKYTQQLNFKLVDISPIIKKVVKNALKYKISVYDASYLTLSDFRKCKFLTSDRKLFNKLKNEISFIKWIGDY